MQYPFEQFLNVRSATGPTVDTSGERMYFLADLTGAPALWSLPLGVPGAWPEPAVTGLDRVQQAFPGPRPGRLIVAADVGGAERTQLYLLEAPGLLPRKLTNFDEVIHHFGSWHPDGGRIALSANEHDPRHFEVHIMNVDAGTCGVVFREPGTYYASEFSPDGSSLLIRQVVTPSDEAVLLMDVESRAVRRLTPEGSPAVYENLTWSLDGTRVFAVSNVDAEFRALVSIDAASGAIATLSAPPCDFDAFALSPDQQHMICALNKGGSSEVRLHRLSDGHDIALDLPMGQAYDGYRWQPTFAWLPDSSAALFAFSPPTGPADIYRADANTGALTRLTHSWAAGIDSATLAPAEIVHYPTFDGREIPAFVFSPPGAKRDGTGPALFFVHGGPEAQTRAVFNPVIQYFANRGFTVIATNVRGSTGYGRAYEHLDDVERRMDSVRDLAAGAEWAAKSGLAHPKRIAVMGGSYGGFMVLAALTAFPGLWAAGVDIVGIANFVTFLERTGPWRRHLREAEYGSLEHHRDLLESISPIHKADRITAPLFVVHGQNDPRVPVEETQQIVGRLRELGREVECLIYPDEGHGLAKLHNKVDAYPRIAAFLERHLGVGLT